MVWTSLANVNYYIFDRNWYEDYVIISVYLLLLKLYHKNKYILLVVFWNFQNQRKKKRKEKSMNIWYQKIIKSKRKKKERELKIITNSKLWSLLDDR